MKSADIVAYLAEDPARLRRPIIDTGERLYLGFGRDVQAELGA
ncbi:MAG: arsenate reductase family protein [Actinomycetota bacterium]